jgi:hypothetical protein
MSKVIAIPSNNEFDAFIQVNTWTRPEGVGPWCPVKDKNNGSIRGWRHYYQNPEQALKATGILPPPVASISHDGGVTWTPMNNVKESEWVSALKADPFTRWHVRKERDRVLARVTR